MILCITKYFAGIGRGEEDLQSVISLILFHFIYGKKY